MAVFENCSVFLDLNNIPFKKRRKLKAAVTDNGGSLSYVINKQCSLIVTNAAANLSSNRLRSILKFQTPVVGLNYLNDCMEKGVLLPLDEYRLIEKDDPPPPGPLIPASAPYPDPVPVPVPLSSPKESSLPQESKVPMSKAVDEPLKVPAKPEESGSLSEKAERIRKVLGKFRKYSETDPDLPTFPDNFQVAKYSIFEKVNTNTWCVLELQSFKGDEGWKYRVVRYWKDDISSMKEAVKNTLVFLSKSEDALEVFKSLRETMLKTDLQLRSNFPPQAQTLGSAPLQELLLEEKLNTGSLSKEVGTFVELLWTEALGCLNNILRVSIDKLSLNDVSRAEGYLLQAQKKLKEENHTEVAALMEEVYTLLPHKAPPSPPSVKLISQKLDLCQVIRDMLNVSEMTQGSPMPSSLGKYRALRCSIETIPPGSSEFHAVTATLRGSKVQIKQVFRVSRGVELQMFKSEIGNVQPLLHSSSPSNFVGVLSRGLLPPRMVVEDHGIERTDIGNLGSGIYFSDSIRTSVKYSKPSATDGSRLVLVCDVALGKCMDLYKKDFMLTKAPEGHNSVHGVRITRGNCSQFLDDEFVVYSPDQVKLKYLVQFTVEGDHLKEFSPVINTSAERVLSNKQELRSEDDGVDCVKNPLEDVTAGLLDSSGQQLPLQAVHVKCKLIDLLSQVIIFQKYTNQSAVPIEAKYVFPLDDSAAVCGFEAFINGKHVIGQVKEKEKARKEYKQAIAKGHGAYLMDQDAPDVFTISVGNLPPGASVLIKVTFVSELIIKNGRILFSLPGSVAPWQELEALNQTTQVTVEKVTVDVEAAMKREFTLDMSIEMPNLITNLQCLTHKVKIKKTDCKAVLSVLPGELMSPDGFQLLVTLDRVHLPRMWVEKHPDSDSQACMLVFYPNFEVDNSSGFEEVVLLIDTSESMKGESLRMAQKIALQALKTLSQYLRINIILFGTDHTEAFLMAQPLLEARQATRSFIRCFSPVGGSTELWRPLRALSLLPPSSGIRNLLLLSDGHIQNAELTLKLLRENTQHMRLFTCGVSPTANRHMLRALAQAGGGAYEFFDTKTKHNWAEKVASQVKRMASPCCSSVSVKWQQFSQTAPSPVQAPKQLNALFNDSHTLVYGFVPHCTKATLFGNLSGQEVQNMVSTTELQKTRGTFLHKLTARAIIRDFEDGSLDTNEAEHEGKKAELKDFVIKLSKEYSILCQFTSFVAIEERDSEQTEEGFTDIPKLIAEENVDILPYIGWEEQAERKNEDEFSEESDDDVGFGLFSSDENDEDDMGMFVTCSTKVESYSPQYEPTSPICNSMKMSKKIMPEEEIGECAEYMAEFSSSWSSVEESAEIMEQSDQELCFISPQLEFLTNPTEVELSDVWAETLNPLLESRRLQQGYSSPLYPTGPQGIAFGGPPSPVLSDLRAKGDIPRSSSTLFSSRALDGPPPPPPPPSKSTKFKGQAFGVHTPPPPPTGPPVRSIDRFPPPPPLCGPPPPPPTAAVTKGPAFGRQPLPPSPPTGPAIRSFARPPPLPGVPLPSNALPFRAFGHLPPPQIGGPPPHSPFTGLSFAGTPPPHPPLAFGGPLPPFLDGSSHPHPLSFKANFFDSHESAGPIMFGSPLNLSYRSLAVEDPELCTASSVIKHDKSPAAEKSPEGADILLPASNEITPTQAERSLRRKISTSLVRGGLFGATAPFSFESSKPSYVTQQKQQSGFSFRCSEVEADLQQEERFQRDEQEPSMRKLKKKSAKMIDLCAEELVNENEPSPEEDSSDSEITYGSREGFGIRSGIRSGGIRRSTFKSQPRKHLRIARSVEESADSEALKVRWTKIFQLQHLDGYWEITKELGDLINVDVDLFANVFLKNKGINSLGVTARDNILRLVATLLVLQLMRVEKLEEGKLLRTLFSLYDSSQPRSKRWEALKKAVDWVCWADRQYPCIYSRLEFGLSWESSTRQLLGYEALPPFSPLTGLNLQKTPVPLLVH
ncbi:protein mono-ADP-ribosyltransferase PARP4 [Cheilinus undulatus]|uniref:protein mono-ADP-ribosyltransferase PARP4 n=1 Tax=Cheilinus undulatus TaxID=241271 RepID=UPI001BD3B24F|nr:protein mono-ADP-ribosyltransferase PARP4 [Cheilinus undulatus]